MTNVILKYEEQAAYALRGLYQQFGYVPYKMSRFEEYDLYVRNKDFLVSDQIITFSDNRGKLLALKPDVTLSIVKNAPEEPGIVQKVYYNENVYRDYREIMQTGLECVGDLGSYEMAEVVLLAVKSLEALGGKFVLDISHMGLLAAVLDSCGFDAYQKKRAMECLRRKNTHELKRLCGESSNIWTKLEAIASCHGGSWELERIKAILTTREEQCAMDELCSLWTMLEASGYEKNVRLDFSVGNDMRYYSGVVFRGYLEGIPSSVLSGGQYDKLPRKMGRKAKAIGFAVYLNLLQDLHREENAFDLDTLILHDGTIDTTTLMEAAGQAAGSGSVLVARQLPRDRKWKTMIRFEKGERVQ